MNTAYKQLLDYYSEIITLNSINGLLYWDMNTYMPLNALEHRTEQFQYIQKLVHEIWTSEKFTNLIAACEKDESLDTIQRRNVQLCKREHENKTILPPELVVSLAKQSNKTLEVWKTAKRKNDFQLVISDLERLLELNMERAGLIAEIKENIDPYEALIDFRDPGFTMDLLTKTFDEIKSFLVPFIRKCVKGSSQLDSSFLRRRVTREIQVQLVNDLAGFLDYDIVSDQNNGRIDEVEHPLTIGCGPNDIRVTVKYHENAVMKAFLAGAHECGHALDSLQRNPEWKGQPVNYRISASFGESQSRILEKIICSSKEFWTYYYPRFKELTGSTFSDIDLDTFYSAINAVKPGFNRIQADEVTYCLHIIIRFELERDLFTGRIDVRDLPEAWNEKYRKYLGVEVPNDTQGVMQDLHWYSQYWGYFHGYGIGNVMASQITTVALTRDLPEWGYSLQEGKFTPIREWLAENIHAKGAMYDSLDSIEGITGEPLSAKYFREYLTRKYSALYGIE
ncbi:MAG: carboxypeptidase M32 [Candidatus Hodarchaeales archaeon]|jgi:carboxypeptidase Taq